MLLGLGAGCSGLWPSDLRLLVCWTIPTPSFLSTGGGAERVSRQGPVR